MKDFLELPKLKAGDKVSIISPSAGAAGMFPWVFDQGLEQLQSVFGLIPKEYPTTREVGASLEDRAQDIMNAFADPDTKAVISAIGGIDQIQLIKNLNDKIFTNNPKPFYGYSDNTHLVNYLWNHGIPSYYGGAIMTQFAFHGGIQPFTEKYLHFALFEKREVELTASESYNDIGLNWADKENLNKRRTMEPNNGWHWDGSKNAEGILWGGCVESLFVQLGTDKFLPKIEDLEGTVLFLETSEEMPDAWVVMYMLIAMGERGWFDKFQAVLVGRPKAWDFGKQNSSKAKDAYRLEQRETILSTVRKYNSDIPIVQNLDFGHTDPQIPMPAGQKVRIDYKNKKIYASF